MKWEENLGKKIREERLSWGMSKKRLAKLSRVDKEMIEAIENGKIKQPNFYVMLNICEILESSVYFYIVKTKTDNHKEEKIKK